MAFHFMFFKLIDAIIGLTIGKGIEADVLAYFPISFPSIRFFYVLAGIIFPLIIGVSVNGIKKCYYKQN